MARKTKYNKITTPELIEGICQDNKKIVKDFLLYLRSMQKSEGTIKGYESDLNIFFVWNLINNNNKPFMKITKREIVSYQNWLVYENENSPARIKRLKAAISSLSNYIEDICDDDPEFDGFKSIVKKIKNPDSRSVLEKTVLSDEQLEMLLDTLVEAGRKREACAVSLAMCSGRRKSELPRFKRYFFDDKFLIANGALYQTPETIKTKGNKYINCYTLAHKFDKYLKLWLEEMDSLGIESEWLLPDKNDPKYHISNTTLDSWARTFSNIMGVDFYWHSLRHYFTTHLSRCGLPDNVIKIVVGWGSVDMVQIYKDIPESEELDKWFDSNGIKNNDTVDLSEIR